VPRIFVRGHKTVPRVQTTASLGADPTPTIRVTAGYVRFWFSSSDKQRYGFVATTDSVVATTKGTDFTIGHDPATSTSTVGVTQDSVQVAPANPVLQPFQLSAGSQVAVTPDRVGAITPLADQSAAAHPSSQPESTTTLALWLVGILLTVAVVAASVGVWSLWMDRRRARPAPATPVPRPPVPAADIFLAPAGAPHSTSWVTLPSGETTDPVVLTGEQPRRSRPGRSRWPTRETWPASTPTPRCVSSSSAASGPTSCRPTDGPDGWTQAGWSTIPR
jgi:hypothetical protein